MDISADDEPNNVILNFLETLALTIRASVYFVLGGTLAGLLNSSTDDALNPDHTREVIHRLLSPERSSGYALIGNVVSIASMLDYVLFVRAEGGDVSPEVAAIFEEKIGNQELAARHSQEAWDRWAKLRETILSHGSIVSFAERVRRPRDPEPPHTTVS